MLEPFMFHIRVVHEHLFHYVTFTWCFVARGNVTVNVQNSSRGTEFQSTRIRCIRSLQNSCSVIYWADIGEKL
jgi:hypothetical protein